VRLALSDVALARGGRPVLAGLSAAVEPGQVTVVLGPNGAGKSTLLEAMAGLLAPSAGTLLLDGAPVSTMPASARARRIGYLPQDGPVHWNLTVRELVALGRLPHRGVLGGPSAADRAAIEGSLAAADLEALAARPVGTLSGGERARALLARVLAGAPELLLADEPLASLDPRHQLEVLALFRRAADSGAAVVLVLHDLMLAVRAADHVLLLADGGLLAAGDPREVLTAANLEAAFGVRLRVREDAEAGLIVLPAA
jgi:iron complex transport system ATP-binding protein